MSSRVGRMELSLAETCQQIFGIAAWRRVIRVAIAALVVATVMLGMSLLSTARFPQGVMLTVPFVAGIILSGLHVVLGLRLHHVARVVRGIAGDAEISQDYPDLWQLKVELENAGIFDVLRRERCLDFLESSEESALIQCAYADWLTANGH